MAVVLLTGASRGLGLSTLEILLRAGAKVVTLSRSETPELSALALGHPHQLVVVSGDVAADGDNKKAVDMAISTFGRLDSLLLNAGTLSPMGPTASMLGRVDEYKHLFDVNFFSLVSIISHAIPHLREDKGIPGSTKGRIVLVSSGASTASYAGWGAYSASKAAMNSLARSLSTEELSITTISVRPGVIDTGMQQTIRSTGAAFMTASDHKRFSSLHDTGSLLPPHEPGGVLAGLALSVDQSLSGQFVSWNDKEIELYKLQ